MLRLTTQPVVKVKILKPIRAKVVESGSAQNNLSVTDLLDVINHILDHRTRIKEPDSKPALPRL